MSNDTDYRDLVDQTVDEVKEQVQNEDLDPQKVLEAEQDNKNRVTLVEWLEERVSDTAEQDTEQAEDVEEASVEETDSGLPKDALNPEPMQEAAPRPAGNRTYALIGSGLIIGFLIASVAFASGVVPVPMGADAEVSPAAAKSQLDTFFEENKAALQLPPGSDISVQSVSQYQNTAMYEAQLQIAITLNNQTMDQTRPAYITPDGRYVFFSQPLDTERPISEQIGQQPSQPTGNATGAR